MGMRLVFVAAAILSVTGIKVPVDKPDETNTKEKIADPVQSPEKPLYYESVDSQVNSYIVPPNSARPLEDISGDIATLATYLLPPSEDKQSDYYKPTESGGQTDWYPIAPVVSLPRQLQPPKQTEIKPVPNKISQSEPIYGNFRAGALLDGRGRVIPIPSRDLQPPLENAPNDYVASTSDEGKNTLFERPPLPKGFPLTIWNGPVISIPNNIQANTLSQFPSITKTYKNPTKLYPKKYAGAFIPIPIPINQFNEESLVEKQKVKPLKGFKTNQNNDNEYETPTDEAQDEKGTLQGQLENIKVEELEASESKEDMPSLEQDTSETIYREPLRQAYPVPSREAPQPASTNHAQNNAQTADGDRTEFRMHGMKGPHSYQFGYDTGKGKNRQFRFEERDNNGHVKGHYGYMDKNGKLRVVNYDADPEHGFRADPPVETK